MYTIDTSTKQRVIRTRANKKVNKVYTGIIDVNKVNTITLKYTRHEEPLVTDNSKVEVIKVPGDFKLFKCGKNFSDNLDATYKRACM